MRLLFTVLASLLSLSVFGQNPCNNQTSVTYQGYEYEIVEIGDQCWFSENCKYLPNVSPSSEASLTDPYYYVYGYEGTDVEAAMSMDNYQAYGVLYNWPAIISNGICPTGWHIPSDVEWQILEISLGMSEFEAESTSFRGAPVGNYIKSTSEWNSEGNGSNSSGFNGIPGGMRNDYLSDFDGMGNYGYWWTSSEVEDSSAWYRLLYKFSDDVYRASFWKHGGMSSRCIKSEDEDSNGINYDGNIDGCVNVTDIIDMLLEYGQCEEQDQLYYDGNEDGCVNYEDVLNMIVEYGSCE